MRSINLTTLGVLLALCYSVLRLVGITQAQGVQQNVVDFSKAVPNAQGQLCVMQEICISDAEALSKLLPGEPCLPEGCNCQADGDCPGENGRCVACKCQECAQSPKGSEIFNPPLTFVIDTTKSVKPDKDSIFNLTQKVVSRIVETNVNIPQYQLVTFNDYGPDINRNVKVFPATQDVIQFRKDTMALKFESFDGGRDSKERLLQGLLVAATRSPEKSLIVIFTDNGTKDLKLKDEILRLRKEKQLEIFLVLTPEYEGNPRDKSLGVYDEVATVFFISEVGADSLLSSVEEFEEGNCL